MVKGIDIFRDYFAEYKEQYVLIGGAACDISFGEAESDFRVTKDLDVVLVVEAQTREFGQKFWQFIKDGNYTNRMRSDGKPQFYRFTKPKAEGYPAMIELFARSNWILDKETVLTPVHIDEAVSSLSAILLDDAYYQALLDGRKVVEGISILKPTWLIPFKAKAWLDLNERRESGQHIDLRDIKKHRNDILRIASELVLESCELPAKVKADMAEFNKKLKVSDEELRNLKIYGVHEADIKNLLEKTYGLQ